MTARTMTLEEANAIAQRRIEELEADYHAERIRADQLFDELKALRVLESCLPILISGLKASGNHTTLREWDRARALLEGKADE